MPILRPIVVTLLALAGAVSAVHAQDAAAGGRKAAMCIGCHGIEGYQASFPQVYKVPMIAGQGAEYLVAALGEYKKGGRRHPTMRAIAATLSDQDIADLSAYYAALGASSIKPVADTPAQTPPADVAALLAKGACSSCHGANFSKPLAPAYPKIAGQHADYLYASLRAYATPDNPNIGRDNAIMVGQVKPFTARELKRMADYIGALPGELRTVPQSKFR